MKTIIITDSGCHLPANYIEEYEIEVFPFSILLNEASYLDGVTITTQQIYQAMRDGQTPTTAQVNPMIMKETFLNHARKGNRCLYIAFSGAMSGTYQTSLMVAEEVKQLYPDFDLDIIDSKGGALATGLVVLRAAEMAQKGKNKEEIVRFVQNQTAHMEHIFTVDNLDALYRGGRLSRTGRLMGNILNIKPVLHVENGRIGLLQLVRGKKRALEKIIAVMEARCAKDKSQIIGICHADDLETAFQLKTMIEGKFGFDQFIIDLIGGVLGVHIGIGGVGVFFANKVFSPT
ncbi:DegV family protein [Capillibacterium thermochitinicola]|uniref:DegV family protein n=1 Tax=Capillibacterium thermochitinicola TaxID=2699427 RepID=A0A8J6LMU3_9FIRM|nr:DegV family protein [Capillibacterium thermochitinicola]MBA2133203.1 DegV family protein [Capillibacterium thermochitinicola]